MRKWFNILCSLALLTGCTNKTVSEDTSNTKSFKEEYEQYNGQSDSQDRPYRVVSIPEDNPFKNVTAEEVVEEIKDGKTFYVYFGDALCPWCRSVIEEAVKVANDNNLSEIQDVDIWDDDHNEILRDVYEYKDGQIVKKQDGSDAYNELLKNFDSVLSDYVITDDHDNTYKTGEKRITAPSFFYIENGKVVRFTTGVSSLQQDSREELTPDMISDEESQFEEFFNDRKKG